MPVQAEVIALPWLELEDAREQVRDAERFGTPDDLDAARALVSECEAAVAMLGTQLLIGALGDHGSLELQRKLAALFGRPKRVLFDRLERAEGRVAELERTLDAMRQQLREMTRRVDDLTHGVGEPGKTL